MKAENGRTAGTDVGQGAASASAARAGEPERRIAAGGAAGETVFFELTRTICPRCRRVLDGKILLRGGQVFLQRTCPDCGPAEALIYADAEAYLRQARYNKPGTRPLRFAAESALGCPYDCGICPEHQQHTCLGIIEVNSACDMRCPLCFADAAPGFQLTLEEVEAMLDAFVAAEGAPEVVQFSGGEPALHPRIGAFIAAAQRRGIRFVMLNTNGKRIARDDGFLAELAELRPAIYLQFDGFEAATYARLRGEADLLAEKLRALDRLAEAGLNVTLVPAIERGVNEGEIGRIVDFAVRHPAVRAISFQPAFHAGRHPGHDPLRRITIPELLGWAEAQTGGRLRRSDFVPVPCCFPTCNAVTYAFIECDQITPLPRLLNVEDYLDYITNRVVPDFSRDVQTALESLWSSAATPGSAAMMEQLQVSCQTCGLAPAATLGEAYAALRPHVLMIMAQDFMDPWTFSQKNLMKCCKSVLLPGGGQVPFCAYNTLGYREQARAQLTAMEAERRQSRGAGIAYRPRPVSFTWPQREGR